MHCKLLFNIFVFFFSQIVFMVLNDFFKDYCALNVLFLDKMNDVFLMKSLLIHHIVVLFCPGFICGTKVLNFSAVMSLRWINGNM